MKLSNRKYALISGISLIAIAMAAGFSYGYVFNTLVVSGDVRSTYENISASINEFIFGIIGWVVIFILDLLVSWGLYRFLNDINPVISKTTAILRVLYSVVLGLAIIQLIQVVPLIGNSSEAPLIMDKVNAFESLWSNGLIIFGMHLFSLGLLTLQAKGMLRIFPYLFLFAGISYFGIPIAKLIIPAFIDQILIAEMILSLPMALSEIAFAFWLIIKGGKTQIVKIKK